MESFPDVSSITTRNKRRTRRFFIAGLCVLAVAVFIYSRLDAWRNAERLRDVQAITNAIHRYTADHQGAYPPGLDDTERQIGLASLGCQLRTSQCSITGRDDCVDLTTALRPYLRRIPNDPGWTGNTWWTHYAVRKEKNGSFIVIPCEYSQ